MPLIKLDLDAKLPVIAIPEREMSEKALIVDLGAIKVSSSYVSKQISRGNALLLRLDVQMLGTAIYIFDKEK